MDEDCPKCEKGLPPWLATFADLMSLLMCFFVLLLSFAEMDAIRFKRMADSMKDAFGVQKKIPANEIVQGISVIKQEFSPNMVTDPSPVKEISQKTTEAEKKNPEIKDGKDDQEKTQSDDQEKTQSNEGEMTEAELLEAARKQIEEDVKLQALELGALLRKEIEQGLVSVETGGTKIIVRIREKGSFASGSADLDPGFSDVLERIGQAVVDTPGGVVVAGHTDNIPIHNARFRSNWELSSGRAVSVVHALLENPEMDPTRVTIEGYADSRPLVPNDTAENRAVNRRVEMVLERGEDLDNGEMLDLDRVEGAEEATEAARDAAEEVMEANEGVEKATEKAKEATEGSREAAEGATEEAKEKS